MPLADVLLPEFDEHGVMLEHGSTNGRLTGAPERASTVGNGSLPRGWRLALLGGMRHLDEERCP